jgi:hypothetical protein
VSWGFFINHRASPLHFEIQRSSEELMHQKQSLVWVISLLLGIISFRPHVYAV